MIVIVYYALGLLAPITFCGWWNLAAPRIASSSLSRSIGRISIIGTKTASCSQIACIGKNLTANIRFQGHQRLLVEAFRILCEIYGYPANLPPFEAHRKV
jgi:hypothetical protein